MSEEYSVDEMLGDEELRELEITGETAEAAEETTGEAETTETAAEATAATEDVEAKEDAPPASEAKQEPQTEEPWTKAAVLDERRKRQELQAQLEQLKAAQNPPEQQQKPDWYDDPDKAAQHQSQELQSLVFNTKLELSQDMMRTMNADYDEAESRFYDMAQANPQLVQQMLAAPNPARFAYETAKNAEKFEQLQNVDEYAAKVEAQVRADVEAKVRAELEAKYQRDEKKAAAISPSLASASSKGGIGTSDYSGEPSLDEILAS